ncbi:CAF1 family ribonuclease-domain-containing protein [Pyronema omphalodes]|nr:CAF1 family ribonuclease-domain-containing protein [Pyronema omphalodes]
MEVTKELFECERYALLREIKAEIKEADFVSIDLEFSGVSKTPSPHGRKHTLEERYKQSKEAASKYQVLQLGICIVRFDKKEKTFITRPFTFPVSAATNRNWRYDREFIFQASALEFLSSHNFDFNETFKNGIPYLSIEEEEMIRKKEIEALDGVKEDIHIDPKEAEFLERSMSVIQEWVNNPKPEKDYVNLTGPRNELNGYQKRIIHQTVRSRFPQLATVSRESFIQVTLRDDDEEAANRAQRLERSEAAIQRGIGLRKLIDILRNSHIPIVGHNLFGDLIQLYSTFVGTLPPTSKEFSAMLHKDFPTVIDTKFLATYADMSSLGASSSLQHLDDKLGHMTLNHPFVTLHDDHFNISQEHNAGYDAMVTARVFIRLVAAVERYIVRLKESKENEALPKATSKKGSKAKSKEKSETVNYEMREEGKKGVVEILKGERRYGGVESGEYRYLPEVEAEWCLPKWENECWSGWKNMLRVNGVEEGVFVVQGTETATKEVVANPQEPVTTKSAKKAKK